MNLMNVPMTGADMMEYNPDARLFKYTDLYNYKTIDELFAHSDKIILLFLTDDHSGHWTGLHRHGDTITFFDSYGLKIDDEFKFIPKKRADELGEKYKVLSLLLRNSPYKILYNKYHLQNPSPEIQTCGRHVSLYLLNAGKMDLDTYVKLFFAGKNKTPDQIVSELIK